MITHILLFFLLANSFECGASLGSWRDYYYVPARPKRVKLKIDGHEALEMTSFKNTNLAKQIPVTSNSNNNSNTGNNAPKDLTKQ